MGASGLKQMNAQQIVVVDGLGKQYGETKAVDGISFGVKRGEMFAFLGPNGAGKSTTINILCTILGGYSGRVTIDGFKLGSQNNQIRSSIGVVFQDSLLDGLLTVRENLETRGSFYGLKGQVLSDKIAEVTSDLNLAELLKRPYGKLSGGQRRRVDIARALLNTPKILFLDEPTTGLDPQTRESVWKAIRTLQQDKGVTIFLTTHYMEEAAGADNVAIIDHGKIVVTGTPAELRATYSHDVLRIVAKDDNTFAAYAQRAGLGAEKRSGVFTIRIADSLQGLQVLKDAERLIDSFEVVHGTMDDVFITITGRELRADGDKQ